LVSPAPLIQLLDDSEARTAYPISWAEQDLLFGKLTEHLRDMAEFDVNTGLRDLIKAANLIVRSKDSPTLTLLRLVA
jgi:hypothetical protein